MSGRITLQIRTHREKGHEYIGEGADQVAVGQMPPRMGKLPCGLTKPVFTIEKEGGMRSAPWWQILNGSRVPLTLTE